MFGALFILPYLGYFTAVNAVVGTLKFFAEKDCKGSSVECTNVPPDFCCQGMGFMSGQLIGNDLPTAISHADYFVGQNCVDGRLDIPSAPQHCATNNVPFASAHWNELDDFRGPLPLTKDGAPSQNCVRPDVVEIVKEDGERVRVTIPDGENDKYEKAFAEGDFASILKFSELANAK